MNPTLTDFDDDRDTVIITASDERTFSRIEPLPRPPIPAAPRRAIAALPSAHRTLAPSAPSAPSARARSARRAPATPSPARVAPPREVRVTEPNLDPPDAWASSLEAELERALERQFPLPAKAPRAARPEPARAPRRPRALDVLAALSLVVAGILLSVVAQRIVSADVVAAVLDRPAPSKPTDAGPRSVESEDDRAAGPRDRR